MAINKLQGPMLSPNLVRNGENLEFDNQLLFLDVNSRRIGVNTDSPLRTLTVNGDLFAGNLLIENQRIDSDQNITLNPAGVVILPYAIPNTVAFIGPQSEITSASGLSFDGTTLESSGGAQFGNISIAGNSISAIGDLNLVATLAGNINLTPSATGRVETNSLYINDVSPNRVVVSDPSGKISSSNNLTFDSANSALFLNGSLAVGATTIANNEIVATGNLKIEASDQIVVDTLNGVQFLNALPTGVFYANSDQYFTTTSDFTFDSGVLRVSDQIEVSALSLKNSQIEATGSGTELFLTAPGSIVTSSTIVNSGVQPGEPLLLTTYNNFNYGLWLSDTGHSLRVSGGDALSNDSVLTTIFEVGRYDFPSFPTGDWNRFFSVLSNGTALVETHLAVGGQSTLGNIAIVNNEIGAVGTGIVVRPNGVLTIADEAGVAMPAGTSSERPTSPVPGTTRFNTETLELEIWNGLTWLNVSTRYANITSQVISGNGINTTFSLDKSTRTEDILVSINGVLQMPISSYIVSGNTITFAQPLDSSDVAEIRYIAMITTIEALLSNPVVDGGSF
jgi:hypothetical protein